MSLLEWLCRPARIEPAPRSFEEIKRAVEDRDRPHLDRLTRVEESLLALTAEAGLEDLKRQLERIKHA